MPNIRIRLTITDVEEAALKSLTNYGLSSYSKMVSKVVSTWLKGQVSFEGGAAIPIPKPLEASAPVDKPAEEPAPVLRFKGTNKPYQLPKTLEEVASFPPPQFKDRHVLLGPFPADVDCSSLNLFVKEQMVKDTVALAKELVDSGIMTKDEVNNEDTSKTKMARALVFKQIVDKFYDVYGTSWSTMLNEDRPYVAALIGKEYRDAFYRFMPKPMKEQISGVKEDS